MLFLGEHSRQKVKMMEQKSKIIVFASRFRPKRVQSDPSTPMLASILLYPRHFCEFAKLAAEGGGKKIRKFVHSQNPCSFVGVFFCEFVMFSKSAIIPQNFFCEFM